MGNAQAPPPPTYSKAITRAEDAKGETPVYRSINYPDKLLASPDPEVKTCKDVYIRSAKKQSTAIYLSYRKPPVGKELGEYVSMTFMETHEIAIALGRGLIHKKMVEPIKEYQNFSLRFLAIYAKNCREWILADQASSLFGITIVPVYDTLGQEAVRFVYHQTNLTTMMCTSNYVDGIIAEKKGGFTNKLENVIVMDVLSDKQRQDAAAVGLQIFHFDEIVNMGKDRQDILMADVKPEDIYTLSYTSGTTGIPKAAMITHGNMVGALAGIFTHPGISFGIGDVHLGYLPLPHIMERLLLITVTYAGAQYWVYNGDVQRLKEDFAIVRPTFFASVPRLFNRFYDLIRTQFDAAQGVKKSLITSAVQTKLENLRAGKGFTHCFYDALVFSKIQAIFGGRVRFLVTASAPISGDVIDFFKICCSCPMFEVYGQTESTGASFGSFADDFRTGMVGGPLASLEFKLVDVDDMNYRATDKDEMGNSIPRGEICLRGPCLNSGYYKDAEKTAEAWDKDGWLHTGDIGQLLPNGALKIIDRKKNIFKLQHGEYVAPEKIEGVLILSPWVAEAFVYGDSLKNYLVGVIVPKPEGLKKLAAENKIEGNDIEALCRDEKLVAILQKELEKYCRANKLFGFEVMKQIYVEPQSFQNYGLFTTTFKLKRNDAKKHYQQVLDKLYAAPVKDS